MMTANFGISFDINLNAVLNAPNLDLALAQMVRFTDLEDKLG
jgi:hypothetical protein